MILRYTLMIITILIWLYSNYDYNSGYVLLIWRTPAKIKKAFKHPFVLSVYKIIYICYWHLNISMLQVECFDIIAIWLRSQKESVHGPCKRKHLSGRGSSHEQWKCLFAKLVFISQVFACRFMPAAGWRTPHHAL